MLSQKRRSSKKQYAEWSSTHPHVPHTQTGLSAVAAAVRVGVCVEASITAVNPLPHSFDDSPKPQRRAWKER